MSLLNFDEFLTISFLLPALLRLFGLLDELLEGGHAALVDPAADRVGEPLLVVHGTAEDVIQDKVHVALALEVGLLEVAELLVGVAVLLLEVGDVGDGDFLRTSRKEKQDEI